MSTLDPAWETYYQSLKTSTDPQAIRWCKWYEEQQGTSPPSSTPSTSSTWQQLLASQSQPAKHQFSENSHQQQFTSAPIQYQQPKTTPQPVQTVQPLHPQIVQTNRPVPTPVPVITSSQNSQEWPESLRNYVNRVFAEIDADQHQVAEAWLSNLVNTTMKNGSMWTIDWASRQLPRLENMAFTGVSAKVSSNVQELIESSSKLGLKRKRSLRSADSDDDSKRPQVKNVKKEKKASFDMKRLSGGDDEERLKREMRARRFEEEAAAVLGKKKEVVVKRRRMQNMEADPNVIDWDEHTIVGTSTKLEKPYLRLTSAPDPATVRPLHILRETLEHLKKKWIQEKNYNWVCDQFKSLRQDLTVQRIKNEFTVKVYEVHARIALEKGDLGEFNQCQSQLKHLYKDVKDQPDEKEFKAYRLLYLLHTRNRREINNLLQDLTEDDKRNQHIAHALQVRRAVANGDYHAFFKLYDNSPRNMSQYLMDHFLDRERIRALKTMCVAYKAANIPVTWVAKELGWGTDKEALENCLKQLKEWNCPFVPPEDKKQPRVWIVAAKDGAKVFQDKWMAMSSKVDIKGQL